MKAKISSKQGEKGLFEQDLEHLLDQRHELYKLANRLPLEQFEEAFTGYYAEVGRPAKTIRQMVGLLLVKQLKNVSDEEVCRLWTENPYVQYPARAGCGEQFFQWGQPCNPSDLVHFRKRIGEKGVEEIFKATVYLHREKIEEEDELVVDTTVQEANVTHPTDVKLRRKIPAPAGWKLGEDVDIKWVSFEENIWDGETLDMTLIQAKSVSEKDYKSALVDRGYQGRTKVSGVKILAPHKKKKTGTYYRIKKDRIRFARRAAIEPVLSLSGEAERSLSHLKNDFRMARCFLKGALGASQNLMLAAAAWNLKKWINESSFCLQFARLLRTLVDSLRTGLDLNLQSKCLSGGF